MVFYSRVCVCVCERSPPHPVHVEERKTLRDRQTKRQRVRDRKNVTNLPDCGLLLSNGLRLKQVRDIQEGTTASQPSYIFIHMFFN